MAPSLMKIHVHFLKPFSSFHKTQISIIGGNINAMPLDEMAPTNEMNKSNFGIAAANATEIFFLKKKKISINDYNNQVNE